MRWRSPNGYGWWSALAGSKTLNEAKEACEKYVREQLGLKVCAIATLADLLLYLSHHGDGEMAPHHERVLAYRQRYGVHQG